MQCAGAVPLDQLDMNIGKTTYQLAWRSAVAKGSDPKSQQLMFFDTAADKAGAPEVCGTA